MAKAGRKGISQIILLLFIFIFLSLILISQLPIFKTNQVEVSVKKSQPAIILQNPEIVQPTTLDQVILLASSSASASGDLLAVDQKGVVFEKADQLADQLKLILLDQKFSVGQNLPASLVSAVVKMKDKLKDFQITVNTSWVFTNILVLNGPPIIIADFNKNVDIQLTALQLILQKAKIDNKELKLIDLRFENPVIKYATDQKKEI
ncbi:MAG: hypothetical protein HYW45_00190 [Candidatus Daviesbacteria bacterium]|nr:MAG: hypothetical protein HYW45_00190 [Candidatus Daviesbacteria bacterium]